MIRYYCDRCEAQVESEENVVTNRVKDCDENMFWIEIVAGVGNWNKGVLCKKCLLEIVNAIAGDE